MKNNKKDKQSVRSFYVQSPCNDSKAQKFLANLNKEVEMSNLGYYQSNNALTLFQKDAIYNLFHSILNDLEIFSTKICESKKLNQVKENKAYNLIFDFCAENLESLRRADHYAFDSSIVYAKDEIEGYFCKASEVILKNIDKISIILQKNEIKQNGFMVDTKNDCLILEKTFNIDLSKEK